MPKFENKEQGMQRLQTLLGERADDEALNFIQDFSTTLDEMGASSLTQEDIDAAVANKDAEWRQRYRDAFFGGADPAFSGEKKKPRKDPIDVPGDDADNPAHFEDLFN